MVRWIGPVKCPFCQGKGQLYDPELGKRVDCPGCTGPSWARRQIARKVRKLGKKKGTE